MAEKSSSHTIRAAGGLVWEGEVWQSRIAVIYRPCYGDWSFPKGKLEQGESFEDAAIREIEEETGCPIKLHSYADSIEYQVNGRPKVVKYWHATLAGEAKFQPNEEVDKVDWLTVDEALARLDYDNERNLIRRK